MSELEEALSKAQVIGRNYYSDYMTMDEGAGGNGFKDLHLIKEAAQKYAKLEQENKELREALEEVIRISDRDHIAWDKAKQALAETGEKQ